MADIMCEHIIGFLNEEEIEQLMTLNNIKEHVEHDQKLFEKFGNDIGCLNLNVRDFLHRKPFERFNYCPKCGEKIDWDKIITEG